MDVIIARRNKKVNGFVFQLSDHTETLLLFMFYLIGLLIGTLTIKNNKEISDEVLEIFNTFFNREIGQSFINNFKEIFLYNFLFLSLSLIFGLCAVGTPVVAALPVIKGIGIGLISSELYNMYSLKGFGYCMLILFPIQIISSFVVIVSSKESILMSRNIFYSVTGLKQKKKRSNDIKLFLEKYGIYFLIIILLSLLSSLLNTFVAKHFTF